MLKTKNSKLCVKFKVPSELQYIIDEAQEYHDGEYLANVFNKVQSELLLECNKLDAKSTYFEPLTDNDPLSNNFLTNEDYEDNEVDDLFTNESSIH